MAQHHTSGVEVGDLTITLNEVWDIDVEHSPARVTLHAKQPGGAYLTVVLSREVLIDMHDAISAAVTDAKAAQV